MTFDSGTIERYFAWDPQEEEEYRGNITGTGTIGGKGRSLLFALKKLKESDEPLFEKIEITPSTFFGVGVFHDFLSSVPRLDSLLREKDPEHLENAFLATPFPDYAVRAVERYLSGMTDPVVVRSSSRLEDSLKHSFAGKYLSTFLINRPEQPLPERVEAVVEQMKRIYARTYFPTASSYRKKHSLPEDEMGLILMRMAGKWRGRYFYPPMAGVGFSRNYRRWTTRIKAEDGVLRVVFGLGTLSTKRGYARTFSLSNPMLRPEGLNPFNIMRHSQEAFQIVGREERQLLTLNITRAWKEIIPYVPNFRLFAQIYHPDSFGGYFTDIGTFPSFQSPSSKICFTFEDFPCRHKIFFDLMKKLLPFLESAMGVPADIEFAYEPMDQKLQLLQCRPLWKGEDSGTGQKPDLEGRKILFKADRMVTNGYAEGIPYLVYVDHRVYALTDQYFEIARALGSINSKLEGKQFILAAPGRVGSSNPQLGVPVKYNELTNCRCIVEIGIPKMGFMPELSYGTHFFSDLEVDDVLYMPVYDGEKNNIFDEPTLDDSPYELGLHPAIRIYRGSFSVYTNGDENIGVVVQDAIYPHL